MKNMTFLPPPLTRVLHCEAPHKKISLLTAAVIATLATASGNAFATTTISTDTTYFSEYNDSVAITSTGQLHGTENQTDMSITGTLSNSGRVSDGKSLSVGGKITNDVGATIEDIGTISGGAGLSNKGTIKGGVHLRSVGYCDFRP